MAKIKYEITRKRSKTNLRITTAKPHNDKTIIPIFVLQYHSIFKKRESMMKPITENVSNGNTKNRQLTIKSVGLCKYISNGIKRKTVKLSVNESDRVATILSFGGSLFDDSITI